MKHDIYSQLERDEGFRSRVYRDSMGKLTIGIGFNLEGGLPLSEEAARFILREHVGVFVSDLTNRLPWTMRLSQPRFAVLVNMAYNMGIFRLLTFVKMLKALEADDYETTAWEMLYLKEGIRTPWYRQVKGRAERLAQQMREDRWI